MEHAWIAGKPAALDAALAEAAKLLGTSRCPLIAGLGTDVAGARAAIALAQRAGAVVDHMDSDALLRDLDVMRSSGVMLTTPGEAHLRADTLLLVGPRLAEAWPELPERVFGPLRSPGAGAVERHIFWLCPEGEAEILASRGSAAVTFGKQAKDLPVLLAALRARVAGRPTGKVGFSRKVLDEVAVALKAARFGVAVWSAVTLDALAIEMMCGLISDLNAKTRFSALPLAVADNGVGVLQTCGWLTGFPMRTGFGRHDAVHDPWIFDGRRLVRSGETDCVVWVSAYRALAPEWRESPPTIALARRGTAFRAPPRVYIEVGCPGVDHAAVQHLASTGTLASVEATQSSNAISVAEALARIASSLPGKGARPC